MDFLNPIKFSFFLISIVFLSHIQLNITLKDQTINYYTTRKSNKPLQRFNYLMIERHKIWPPLSGVTVFWTRKYRL